MQRARTRRACHPRSRVRAAALGREAPIDYVMSEEGSEGEFMAIRFSRWLAVVGGILAPLLETIRRWSTWQQTPANLFDDYIMGAFLLYAAWRTGQDVRSGQRFLIAAWSFACGLGYYSFFGQLDSLRLGQRDPAAIASEWVLLIKGIAWGSAIIALALSVRRLPDHESLTAA